MAAMPAARRRSLHRYWSWKTGAVTHAFGPAASTIVPAGSAVAAAATKGPATLLEHPNAAGRRTWSPECRLRSQPCAHSQLHRHTQISSPWYLSSTCYSCFKQHPSQLYSQRQCNYFRDKARGPESAHVHLAGAMPAAAGVLLERQGCWGAAGGRPRAPCGPAARPPDHAGSRPPARGAAGCPRTGQTHPPQRAQPKQPAGRCSWRPRRRRRGRHPHGPSRPSAPTRAWPRCRPGRPPQGRSGSARLCALAAPRSGPAWVGPQPQEPVLLREVTSPQVRGRHRWGSRRPPGPCWI